MRDSIRDTLENLKKKEKDLNASLSTPEITSNIQKLTSLNKELSEISNIVEDYEKYLMLEKNLEQKINREKRLLWNQTHHSSERRF